MTPSLRILYVEDEPLLREVIRDELVELGYDVVAIENGRKALEYLQSHPVDAVITDLKMPELDGLSLRRAAGGLSATLDQVWILLTAFSDEKPEELAQIGFDEVFYKPIKPEVVAAMCQKLSAQKLRARGEGAPS